MKPIEILSVLLLTSFFTNPSTAAEVGEEAKQSIRALFGENAEIEIASYKDQLLEITVGPKTLFASKDGQYIFAGPVLETKTRIDLVELKDKQYRQRRLSQLDPDMYLSFPASATEQHAVTVFTDIDCTFCRRLHTFMPEYNELGITINYVMMPRAGLNSASYNKAVSVFCSNNPAQNMTLAMKGEFNQENSCENAITRQFQLAMEFGINSTPTMIMPDGEIKVGFLPPAALLDVLGRLPDN